MKTGDKACPAKGYVSPFMVDVRTGKRIPFGMRRNTLSYMSAEAMAAAFGGDPSYIPARMGFIYGPETATLSGSIGRRQSWDELILELGNANADVQVVSFSYSPSLGGWRDGGDSGSSSSSDSSSGSDGAPYEGDYCTIKPTGANAITFHAVSNSSDGGMRGSDAFKNGDRIFQAVLLGWHGGDYYVISRVSLDKNGSFQQKPQGFEIALDWTIVFR